MVLIEATGFSGRPKKCHEYHKGINCPFPECNYKLNQFCYNKKHFTKKDKEISALKFEILEMQGKVEYADWTKHKAGENLPTTKHRVWSIMQ